MKKIFQAKKFVLSILTVALVVIIYFGIQSIASPARGVTNQENPIQFVSEQPNVDINKPVPNQFNGQIRKVAYLTFDDGPGKYTAELLDILKQQDVKVTFFLIREKPKLTRPPYGSMPGLNEELRNKVVEGRFKVWNWTIDSLDWKYNNVPIESASINIAQNVLTNAKKLY